MILNVHVPGACCYEIGDEIWQQPLAEAIRQYGLTVRPARGVEVAGSPAMVVG